MHQSISRLIIGLGIFACSVCSADQRPFSAITANGKGAVASVSPEATALGLAAFANGGNAVDAALAMAFALGVVDSHNSGIGGGCFILARLADGRVIAIDGREMAPAAATADMFIRDGKVVPGLSKTGALAIGVPGSVAALHDLHQLAAKRSFAQSILPAAQLAEEGFPIGDVYAKRLQRRQKKLAQFDASKAIFLPADTEIKPGMMLRQKDLAKTYRKLAKHGPDYFYRGHFSKAVAKWMKKNGGIITRDDFKAYHTVNRTPVTSQFLGYELVGFPPPSSGGIHVAQILTMLESLDVKSMSDAERYHAIIEVSKRAFADRAHWLGDADFVSVPKGLLDAEYLKKRAADIQLKHAVQVDGHGLPPNYETLIFGKHTTHLTAADSDGNWVAITTTLNTSFGSGVTIPGTGVLMNNQMDDFSAQPGSPNAFGLLGEKANAIQAKKRPLSSMSPTLVLKDGLPVLTAGAAGGPTIISQVAQTVLNYLLLDLSLADAMALPRVHHQWRPDRVFIDGYASDALKAELTKKGHQLRTWPAFGATQAISIKKGVFSAESEPRIQ